MDKEIIYYPVSFQNNLVSGGPRYKNPDLPMDDDLVKLRRKKRIEFIDAKLKELYQTIKALESQKEETIYLQRMENLGIRPIAI